MIRGTKRPRVKGVEIIEPEAQKIDAKLNASIHNRFDVEVIDVATGEVRQRAQAQNVICNALWTRLLAPNTYFNYIHYGTGAGTPAATDTSLFTFLGYGTPTSTGDVYESNPGDGYVSVRRQIQLSEATAVGATLTEVGIGYSTTASSLCTHAMLKDMNGNQISIVKSDTDIINIYATVFVHWNSEGYDNGSIIICETPFGQRALIDALCGKVSFATSALTYMASKGTTIDGTRSNGLYNSRDFDAQFIKTRGTTKSYDTANKRIVIAVPRLAVGEYNVGGLDEISFCSDLGGANPTGTYYTYYRSFSLKLRVGGEWFPSTEIIGESIGTGDGTRVDFKTSFPLVYNAAIYVDGIETTVTVDENVPFINNDMGSHFNLLPAQSQDSQGALPCMYPPVCYYGSSSSYLEERILGSAVYYNPCFAAGINSLYLYAISGRNSKVECSNNLTTWETIFSGTTSGTVTVPSEYENYKYWRLENCITQTWRSNGVSANNIHFAVPPPAGAVITADYTTKTIAKDANHVFDLTVTIQLGEHTE